MISPLGDGGPTLGGEFFGSKNPKARAAYTLTRPASGQPTQGAKGAGILPLCQGPFNRRLRSIQLPFQVRDLRRFNNLRSPAVLPADLPQPFFQPDRKIPAAD